MAFFDKSAENMYDMLWGLSVPAIGAGRGGGKCLEHERKIGPGLAFPRSVSGFARALSAFLSFECNFPPFVLPTVLITRFDPSFHKSV